MVRFRRVGTALGGRGCPIVGARWAVPTLQRAIARGRTFLLAEADGRQDARPAVHWDGSHCTASAITYPSAPSLRISTYPPAAGKLNTPSGTAPSFGVCRWLMRNSRSPSLVCTTTSVLVARLTCGE